MGSFVALLDATVVNVALPAIERDLGGGLAGQQWVVNAYLLVLGSLILVGGRLGDVFGERRGFSPGGGGVGAGAPGCAPAPPRRGVPPPRRPAGRAWARCRGSARWRRRWACWSRVAHCRACSARC